MPRRSDRRARALLLLGAALVGVLAAGVRWPGGTWGRAAAGERAAVLPPPPAPDAAFYAARLAAFVETHCAACHRVGGGRLRLPAVRADGTPDRRADFEALLPFVDPQAPWQSRLLRKVLEPADGGDEHAGGAFCRAEDATHDLLLDFVSGATLSNLPPEVWFESDVVRGTPGETVVVDGRDSFDRDRHDRDALAFAWTLVARPADSRVALGDRQGGRLELQPDSPGTYVVRLRVSDGLVWSAPRDVTIEVLEGRRSDAPPPGGRSGLERLEPAALRRVRRLYLDLLGRPPRLDEAWADGRRPSRELAADLLGRAEHGRSHVEDVVVSLALVDDDRPVGEDARDLALRIPSEGLSPVEVERVLARDPAFRARLRDPEVGPAWLGALLASTETDGVLAAPASVADTVAALQRVAAGATVDVPGLGSLGDPDAALDAVLASPAFADMAVRRHLGRLLGVDAAARRLGEARAVLAEGPAAWRAFLVEAVTASGHLEASALRAKGRLRLLRSLYVDLLERRPTDRELTALVRASDRLPGSVAPHTVLAKMLIDSGQVELPLLVDIRDGPAWLGDRFLRHLGRLPSEGERTAYGRALLDPDGGVELVVLALVTNAEYACR